MAIKNILFDFGGVIVDLDRDACVRSFIGLGYPQAAELLDPCKQSGIFLELEEGKITARQLYDHIRRETGKNLTDEAINEAYNAFAVDVPAYKIDMLLALRRRFKVYMLSNINPIILDYIAKRWFSAEGRTLEECFDHCFLSYEMGMVKPDPAIFRGVISAAKIDPADTLFLDDGPANVEEGRRQGFQTRLVERGENFSHIFDLL